MCFNKMVGENMTREPFLSILERERVIYEFNCLKIDVSTNKKKKFFG